MSCSFSLAHYERILDLAAQKYDFASFLDTAARAAAAPRRLYWRHDLDISLAHSLPIASVDHAHRVRATFFIRPDSFYYNVFHARSRAMLGEVASLGHYLGLHFDHRSLPPAPTEAQFVSEIQRQWGVLAEYFPMERLVSFHRPSPAWFGKSLAAAGFVSTYDDHFFNQTKYLSDSRGEWKAGCVCRHLAAEPGGDVHVLTHPVWWTTDMPNQTAALTRVLEGHIHAFDQQLGEEIKVYQRQFPASAEPINTSP